MLDARGLTTRPSLSHSAHALNRGVVSRMLRDPYYCGVIIYKGESYTGRHQPLVSSELFDEVQQVYEARREQGTRDVRHRHYLRGRISCGECRQAGRPGRMVYSQNRGRGGTYEYLICVAHQHRRCSMPSVRIDLVETLLARLVAADRLPLGLALGPNRPRTARELWKKASRTKRRDLLPVLFQDIMIYSSDMSSAR